MLNFLVTGGAGFIGSSLVRHLVLELGHEVVNVDKLTYAGNLESLGSVSSSPLYKFECVDICNKSEIERIVNQNQPDVLIHLAAESHVDRSIDSPENFIHSNIVGTFILLEVARKYWASLSENRKKTFRFHHVSTDEVYGDLDHVNSFFTENTPYAPSSPYSASKASSDHLVRSWTRTYGLPTVITNCSNNYGPFQFPEKLVPLVILNAINGGSIPVYGDGSQVRDWLFVDDHAEALVKVALEGVVGETYNIGGCNEKTNLDVVKIICSILDELRPIHPDGISRYDQLISFVADRPGHDLRYAIDASKISRELNWQPKETFETGIRKTITWYLDNKPWWTRVQNGSYRGERLGLGSVL